MQLYIRDYAASFIRPVKELKRFEKINLKAGESKKVNFTLTARDLSFYYANGKLILEPGKFTVFTIGNSKDTRQADFEVK